MRARFLSLALAATMLAPVAASAADIIVVPGDPPGVGFNDPTPATPIGGNPGTTVGEQALNSFQAAANRWGSKLVSDQPIYVVAFFTPLSCTATSGTLGAAAANWYFADAEGGRGGKALPAATWYHAALAEKITRLDLTVEADPDDPFEIYALFNSNLGKPGCLQTSGWYYGLDNNEPANRIDLMSVVLHEFGHGLGFSAITSGSTGARFAGLPGVWEQFMLDVTTGKRWLDMTNAERAASARRDGGLVWAGRFAADGTASTLNFGPKLTGLQPEFAPIELNQAAFGGTLGAGPVRASIIAPLDSGGPSQLDGCEPYGQTNTIRGNIVLVNRGNCQFNVKAQIAQAAGAAALLIANNAAGTLSPGGADPTITIPVLGITQAQGTMLRGLQLPYVQLRAEPLQRAGATAGYPRLYAPTTYASGSSVSHWDVTLSPNMLMEPFINSDIGRNVKNPDDLTKQLFKDIGW